RDSPDCGHGGQVERVTRMLSKSANTKLAQDHVVIAFSHDVFGGEQPFFQCGSHSPFQQHGQLRSASPPEKRKVLHAASADLNDVAVLFDETDMGLFERFSNDLQSKCFADLRHDFPPLPSQALKCVRRASRFPYAAAKETRAALLYCFCYSE